MQLVNLQPNVESPQYHPGRARRFRRFRRFRRYGGKTTSTEQETTSTSTTTTTTTTTTATAAATTTTTTTTAATTTTTTTTTRVVCTGGNSGTSNVRSQERVSTPTNTFTFGVDVGSQCECLGSPVDLFDPTSIPGFLGAVVTGVADPNSVSFISITSPNGTEVKVAPVVDLSLGRVSANTVAFNGFEANGDWTVKLIEAGGLSTPTADLWELEFGLIECSQVLPTPDCAGNTQLGRQWSTANLTVVGTTVSPTPTLLQFDVGAGSECCVTPGTRSVTLRLGTDPIPSQANLAAAGLSPDAVGFDLSGILLNFSSFARATARPTQSFPAGSRAAGLWSLNTSTDGPTAVINDLFGNPNLAVAVESCNQAR